MHDANIIVLISINVTFHSLYIKSLYSCSKFAAINRFDYLNNFGTYVLMLLKILLVKTDQVEYLIGRGESIKDKKCLFKIYIPCYDSKED